MRKLKLVVSDLHLGVGKFHSAGEINQLEEFYYDERFAEFLNYYSTGEFQEADVELILNGDILNFLQVDYRGHFLSVITESISLEKLKNIVAGHPIFFEALRKFSRLPNHSVVYIVGNHDQCMLWPATRVFFSESVGTEVKFRNIVYFFDGVHIEHGHMHEVANRLDPKKFFLKKDVPEPILNLPLGSHFFVDFVLKVKMENPYIDKVRPFTALIRWGLFFNTNFTLKTLGKLIGYFVSRIFASEGSKYRWPMRRLFQILTERAIFPDLTTAAKRVLEDDRIHTVIFGHSHVYQYRQFGRDKEYFNTGTWTELTSLEMASLGKITKLTYVLIEYPSELLSAVIHPESSPNAPLLAGPLNPPVAISAVSKRPRGRLKQWRGYNRIEEDVDVS